MDPSRPDPERAEPSEEAIEAAKALTSRLFTSAVGLKIARLVLTTEDGRDCGGWCEGAIVDRAAEALDAFAARAREPRQSADLPPDATWERAARYWKDAHDAARSGARREAADICKTVVEEYRNGTCACDWTAHEAERRLRALAQDEGGRDGA